jgi:hypothetical protein
MNLRNASFGSEWKKLRTVRKYGGLDFAFAFAFAFA